MQKKKVLPLLILERKAPLKSSEKMYLDETGQFQTKKAVMGLGQLAFQEPLMVYITFIKNMENCPGKS